MNTITTINKRKSNSRIPKNNNRMAVLPENGKYSLLQISGITFGKNYRKYISDTSLQELSCDIAKNGILSPVTVRERADGKFELVIGQRRLKAAMIAGLIEIPAVIRNYTDDQVMVVQFLENYNRENPHPLDDAHGFKEMQESGKSIEDISNTLGKSKSFVFNRLKLVQLIPELQEIFYLNKFNISESLELASLSPNSQMEFFDEYCGNWKDDDFMIHSFEYVLSRFKCDLKQAPFDTNDATLVPNCGACGNCPFNSATLQSLFPEMANEAICSNKSCFAGKCQANARKVLNEIIEIEKPAALIISHDTPKNFLEAIPSHAEARNLPQLGQFDIQKVYFPEPPDENDYMEDDDSFDQSGYDFELEAYHSEMAEFNNGIATGEILKGVSFDRNRVNNVYFRKEAKTNYIQEKQLTAKQVQELIKSKQATPQILEDEITRIETREVRAKELDKEKIQAKVHHEFSESLANGTLENIMNSADQIALRFLLFESLPYQAKATVRGKLFEDHEISGYDTEEFYNRLGKLSEQEICYMIRMAIAHRSGCDNPGDMCGYTLHHMAAESGCQVNDIEKEQGVIAKKRQETLKGRIKDLQRLAKKLTPKLKSKQ